mgnify:CR=1 FL=1
MAEKKERLYFAYGSNINLEQMAQRCPDAEAVGPVVLEDYELLFRGNRAGCGVATIEPLPGSQVHGLLWKLTPQCERSLDFYEGYPRLYGKDDVTVRTSDGQELSVMAYITSSAPIFASSANMARACASTPLSGRIQSRPVMRMKLALSCQM